LCGNETPSVALGELAPLGRAAVNQPNVGVPHWNHLQTPSLREGVVDCLTYFLWDGGFKFLSIREGFEGNFKVSVLAWKSWGDFFLFQASPFRGEEEVSSKILTLKPLKLTLLLDPLGQVK